MTLFRDPLKHVDDLARKDAAFDQDHEDELVVQTLGLRPGWYPERSLEHLLWAQRSDTTRLDGWNAELDSAEEALVDHQPRWLLVTLFILVVLVEFEAGILFWKDFGVTGITRLVMAAATAGTTIVLPWILIELGKQRREQ